MKRLVIDIETNMAHDTIWCVVTQDVDTSEVIIHRTPAKLVSMCSDYDQLIGHNVIGFDFPILREVWGISVHRSKAVDTLVMSRLENPIREGGHSLKNWGKLLEAKGFNIGLKGDFTDFDGGLTDEMITYCKQDVNLNVEVYKDLTNSLETWGKYEEALQLEHAVQIEISRQERNGFNFDDQQATILQAEIADKMADIESRMHDVFPPIVEQRISEKTGKRLKDKITRFNVGSRKQIGERLQSLGWTPKEFTDSGQAKVDETVLSKIDLSEAKFIAEFLTLQKTASFLSSWLKNIAPDGKIHGKVITCGAITNRMAHHSPNLGQVPSTSSMYGEECRRLFIPDKGHVLVGADLSGIELRCLAHYMQDDPYTREILEGDIHTANQKAAGLETRKQAKTFIYAFLYGAGGEKLGGIVGKGATAGNKLKKQFLTNVPKLDALMQKVQRLAKRGYIIGLDGRQILIRSEHSALNMLLQSCGAIIAKQWIVEVHKLMRENHVQFKMVAMVHDEIQASVPPSQAELAGKLMVAAAIKAGEALKFRMPVDAEYAIGKSWLDTH